jgi:hypothetical protein
VPVTKPVIAHSQIAHGADVVFEMSAEVEAWGNDAAVLKALGVQVGSVPPTEGGDSVVGAMERAQSEVSIPSPALLECGADADDISRDEL